MERSGSGAGRTARLARIEGRVQGVGFRYWIEGRARSLRLRGNVRNLTDGALETPLAGPVADVARMRVLLHEGPPAAHVDRVTIAPARAGAAPEGGRRARTGAPGSPV